jgi:hypothetical protein
MNQSDLVINTASGQMLVKDIPEVCAECVTSQSVRMVITMSILAIVSIIFLTALNLQDYNCVFNMNIKTEDLPLSYAVKNADEEKYMKSFVMGSKIQVHSPVDNLLIKYIIPRFSSQFTGCHELVSVMGSTQDEGQGSMYEIDLVNDRPISTIKIIGSEHEKDYKKLDSAKVIIRNEEGRKVWTSGEFLKPKQINYVRVIAY